MSLDADKLFKPFNVVKNCKCFTGLPSSIRSYRCYYNPPVGQT